MARLVALDMAGGPAFVDAVRRCWDDGDVVLPLDRRLTASARRQLLAVARPHAVVTGDGQRQVLDAAAPTTEVGDALLIASSGSTGAPKLVLHTHDSLLAHARAVHQRLSVGASDRWLACLPLNHMGGFGVIARAVTDDIGVDVVDGFEASLVQGAPAELGTTLVSLVPAALDRIELNGFRTVLVGGSADPVDRASNVVHTYGMTESGGGVVYQGHALEGVEVAVDDTDAILLRGPTIARGVRDSTGTVTPLVDSAGWLLTGDLGRWGDDGRLVVVGRADDLIITGGENVWPASVESALQGLPAIAECVVFGSADPTWGQRVTAVVVPVDSAAAPTLDEIRTQLAGTLPRHALPRELRLTDELARTSLGKLTRPQ